MSKAKETADAQRKEAKEMLCSAIGLPEDVMSGAVDRAVDCIISAAVLELSMIINQVARERVENMPMSDNP